MTKKVTTNNLIYIELPSGLTQIDWGVDLVPMVLILVIAICILEQDESRLLRKNENKIRTPI